MGAAEWHRPAEGSQPPAAGAAHGYLQTRPPPPRPRKQAGRWSPGFTQPDSALSSECAEGVTPADSNKQVGSRGERKARQNGELSSSQKSIPERHAPLSLRRAGSLGSRRRTKKHDLGIFPRPLFFFFFLFFQGHSVTFPGLSFLLCRMETTCTDHAKRNGGARRGLSENRGASGLCHQEGFRGDNLVRRSAALRGTIT